MVVQQEADNKARSLLTRGPQPNLMFCRTSRRCRRIWLRKSATAWPRKDARRRVGIAGPPCGAPASPVLDDACDACANETCFLFRSVRREQTSNLTFNDIHRRASLATPSSPTPSQPHQWRYQALLVCPWQLKRLPLTGGDGAARHCMVQQDTWGICGVTELAAARHSAFLVRRQDCEKMAFTERTDAEAHSAGSDSASAGQSQRAWASLSRA